MSHDVSLFKEEVLKDTSRLLLNVLQLNKLGQSSFKFPPRGFSESCDLSRSACSTSLGLTPILCQVLAPNDAENASLPHGR